MREIIEKIRILSEYTTEEIEEVVEEICTENYGSFNHVASYLLRKFEEGLDLIKVWRETKSLDALDLQTALLVIKRMS